MAVVLLLLFTLSVTPKQLLHDAITGHKHSYAKHDGKLSLNAPDENAQCTWRQHAVESPFIDQADFHVLQPVIVYTSYVNHYTFCYYSIEHSLSSLRGPPAQA